MDAYTKAKGDHSNEIHLQTKNGHPTGRPSARITLPAGKPAALYVSKLAKITENPYMTTGTRDGRPPA